MPSVYETQLKAARLNQLALLQDQQKLFDKVLADSHKEIGIVLDGMVDSTDTIKWTRLRAVQREIEGVMDNTMDLIRDYTVRDISQSAEFATQARLKAGMAYVYEVNPDLVSDIPKAFATINVDAVRAVLARTYNDNKTFSDRIWDLRNHSKTIINETVAKAVTQGTSARNLAKQLEPYLKGYQTLKPDMLADDEFMSLWRTMRRQRGDLRYNAMRLARTEVNNAFREGAVKAAERGPWVKGLKWMLSASHPKPDICDVWATQDIDGLGSGVYKPGNLPVDHPNGLCYVNDELVSKDELMAQIREDTLTAR